MPTLILPPRFSNDSNTLWRAAIARGWDIERLQSWRVPDDFSREGEAAIYGESMWANFVAQQLGWHLFEPPLDWLARLSPQFLGRSVEFYSLNEAREKTFPLFVKPAGEKSFAAQIYNAPEELPPDDDSQETVWTLVSNVVRWEVEYRFFVREGRIETASSYWREEDSTLVDGVYQSPPDELEEAHDFVHRLLLKEQKKGRSFSWHGAVVDVGKIAGFGWAVVEANPAFASGIYGCDPERVLETVKACLYWLQREEHRPLSPRVHWKPGEGTQITEME